MNRMLRKLRTDTSGNALAIFAAALVPLTIVIGSGLDLSSAYMAKAKLQNACDAAALAGRQSMDGTKWTTANEDEAEKFFYFNFPRGTMKASGLDFDIGKDPNDSAQIIGTARAVVPTSLMGLFGFDGIPIEANCDAKRDLGHNDVMLVLDTTGSMGRRPSSGGSKDKIDLYRNLMIRTVNAKSEDMATLAEPEMVGAFIDDGMNRNSPVMLLGSAALRLI